MGLIEDKFNYCCQQDSDINEHIPTLQRYASECGSIIEMGVRTIVSTWGLLMGKPKKMISIDIKHPAEYGANIDEVYSYCKDRGINFEFIQASTLDITIEETDLLFIDTIHTYEQLSQELNLHGNKAAKYLIFHDTESCPEINKAITEFIADNNHWHIKEVFYNNNGLTVLKRSI